MRASSYYQAGRVRVALRRSGYAGENGVKLLLSDHLGSIRVVTGPSGVQQYAAWYDPLRCTQGRLWGGVRSVSGSPFTDYAFQGQRETGWAYLFFRIDDLF
jgi:hypothetical protein